MDRLVGHRPEPDIQEEADGHDQADRAQDVDGDPGDAEGAVVVAGGFEQVGVGVGVDQVGRDHVEEEVKAAQRGHQIDVRAVKAAQDEAHQPEYRDGEQQVQHGRPHG